MVDIWAAALWWLLEFWGECLSGVTVILPTYNERDNIEPLIEGVLTHVRAGS